MPTGTVKWYNNIIGQGVITADDGSGIVTVSWPEVKRAGLNTLAEGHHLKYRLITVPPRERSAVDIGLDGPRRDKRSSP